MFSGIYVEKLFSRAKIIPVGVVILLSILTFEQNKFWQSDIALFGKMVDDAPSSALARNNLGVAYLEAGNPLKALPEFQKAVQLDPSYGYAVFNLGDTYQSLGDPEQAMFYLKKAIAFNPADSRAYNSLGLVYRKIGRYQEAVTEFNLSLIADPKNYEAHYNLARLLSAMGQEKDAAGHYIEFLKLAPGRYGGIKREVEKMLKDKGITLN